MLCDKSYRTIISLPVGHAPPSAAPKAENPVQSPVKIYTAKHKGLSSLDAESVFFAPKLYFLYRERAKKSLKE